jgi:DNA repair exonuclease SbcCD ATPase subunit
MVDDLRALVLLEREEASESERLHRLDTEVAELRTRFEAIASFFTGERDEDRRRRLDEDEARAEVGRREAEIIAAENELARAANDTERALAEQRVTRARDHLEVAAHGAERAAERRAEFEREAEELTAELPRLEQRARELSREIPGGTPPEDGDLTDWASRARAALFVATSQVDARREDAIREANELASALLGESTHGSTAEQALERVNRYWKSARGQVSESR